MDQFKKSLSDNEVPCGGNNNENKKYMFVVEWYDPVAQIVKKFLMSFYSQDQSVELYDLNNHRIFLKRCKQEGINLENLYKTAIVTVMSRQMKVIEYADSNTKHKFEVELSQTFCIIKPDVVSQVGEIIHFLGVHGFKIINMKMGQMSQKCVSEFYEEHAKESYLLDLVSFLSSGPSIGISMIGENAIQRWLDFMGPANPEVARKEAPKTLRAIYGKDILKNSFHGSKNSENVARETEFWFPKTSKKSQDYILSSCELKDSTCCVVKPHSVLEGSLGPIINFIIENGFKITAMEMFNLDVPTAEEFLEVYKGVVPEYSAMVVQFTSGPSVALEVVDTKNPQCSQENFRKLAGPADPEIARKLRPDTLRAKFGKTKVLNAVHCTDLPDDAFLEVEYFFKVLQI